MRAHKMRAHKKTECSLSKRASALEPGPQGLGQGLSQKGPGQEGQEGTGHLHSMGYCLSGAATQKGRRKWILYIVAKRKKLVQD